MQKTELVDAALCQAIEEMAQGLIDADLGGGIIKKRVPLAGRGKRGGARTLIATNFASRWYFVFGFEKNEQANIAKDELRILQEIAKDLLSLSDIALAKAISQGELIEICHGNEAT